MVPVMKYYNRPWTVLDLIIIKWSFTVLVYCTNDIYLNTLCMSTGIKIHSLY